MPANAGAAEPEADRELTITRSFDAPARLLFLAWSKPEHLKKWFGPVGYPVTMCEMDFRKGGQWRAAMTGPSGTQQTPFGGEERLNAIGHLVESPRKLSDFILPPR